MKLSRQHERKWFIIPIFLLLVGFIVFVRNSFSVQQPVQTIKYLMDGPYASASWLVVVFDVQPISVTASNTGTISQVMTLSNLTAPLDAAYHQVNGWHPPTGWFWDQNNTLLYILFIGNGNTHPVELTVASPLATSGTVTQTVTSTATTTVTTTSTQTTTVYDRPHFFVAVASSDLSNNIFAGLYVNVHRVGDPNGVGYWPSGYTTYLFPVLTNGDSYQVCIFDTSSHFFNHWDDGTTDRCKVVSPTENVLLVAYFSG